MYEDRWIVNAARTIVELLSNMNMKNKEWTMGGFDWYIYPFAHFDMYKINLFITSSI
jgi:hypothetical protein